MDSEREIFLNLVVCSIIWLKIVPHRKEKAKTIQAKPPIPYRTQHYEHSFDQVISHTDSRLLECSLSRAHAHTHSSYKFKHHFISVWKAENFHDIYRRLSLMMLEGIQTSRCYTNQNFNPKPGLINFIRK